MGKVQGRDVNVSSIGNFGAAFEEFLDSFVNEPKDSAGEKLVPVGFTSDQVLMVAEEVGEGGSGLCNMASIKAENMNVLEVDEVVHKIMEFSGDVVHNFRQGF